MPGSVSFQSMSPVSFHFIFINTSPVSFRSAGAASIKCRLFHVLPEHASIMKRTFHFLKKKQAPAACRIEVDAPGKWPNTWQRTGVVIETKDDPELDNDNWRKDISLGAEHILQESIITCTDPHYDDALASRS